jgi:pyruvate carboxylase
MASEYNEVFEDAADSSTVRTIHRVRANSTIMHLNKIMVANRGEIRKPARHLS